MAHDSIVIRGAREHNLADVDVDIPRDKLVVITGLSGSGKSSLAFDTIYAEGQRRYVESLSSYARQFLGQDGQAGPGQHRRPLPGGLHRPEDHEQKPTLHRGHRGPRSTTTCACSSRAWAPPHCPECGRVIERQTTDQVADKVLERAQGPSRPGAGARGPRPQGRVHQALRGPAPRGLLARAHRRRGARAPATRRFAWKRRTATTWRSWWTASWCARTRSAASRRPWSRRPSSPPAAWASTSCPTATTPSACPASF